MGAIGCWAESSEQALDVPGDDRLRWLGCPVGEHVLAEVDRANEFGLDDALERGQISPRRLLVRAAQRADQGLAEGDAEGPWIALNLAAIPASTAVRMGSPWVRSH